MPPEHRARDMVGLHVLIVPAWWPSPEQPGAGLFNVDHARAFDAAGARVGVVAPDLVSLRVAARHARSSQSAGTIRACFAAAGGDAAIPLLPRLTHERVGGAAVVHIRGLHTALGRPSLHMGRFLRWLRRGFVEYVAANGPPDVLHAMCAIPAGWAATRLARERATAGGRMPVVITEHTGPFALALAPPRAGDYTRLALAEADAVVAVSGHLRGQMIAAGVTRPIEVIPNPVADEFAFAPPPVPGTPAPPAKATTSATVVFVGRLTAEKGARELAAAAARLAAEPPLDAARNPIDVRWHVIGDGPLADELRNCADAPPLQGRFSLHGWCDRAAVRERIRSSNLLVLPSHGETFALAAAEALCCGRPVIGTRGTAIEELIDESNGLLCPIGDAAALADAVRSALQRPQAWDHRAIAGHARARFDGAAVAARYAELFRGLIARSVG